MVFGDEIRSAASLSTIPSGIGGDVDTIWHCDANVDKVYELSTTDFSVDREVASPGAYPSGIGGDANTIWHCDYFADKVYELSTMDFSVDREAVSPDTNPSGIGGDANTIWHCGIAADKVYELSTTDFSVDREAVSPDISPFGIGGDADTIWHCDFFADKVYELSTTDFSVDREANSPSTNPYGIGGDANTIWHCDATADKIYELDLTPPSYIHKIASFAIAADGIWTGYNLHTLQGVPLGAVAEIVCANKNVEFARLAGVRTDGSGLNRYIDLHEAEGLGVTTATMFVKCHETTGLIECYSEIQGDVDFYLLGYFVSEVDFTEAITNLGQPGVDWADKDLTASGVPANAVVQILMGNDADAANFFAGVRAKGSVLERGYTLDEAEADGWSTLSMVVKSDSSAVIEWKAGSVTDVTMWLLGYFSSNVDFTEGFTDYSPAADSTWTEKTIAEAAVNSVVAFALMHCDFGAETFCGLRKITSVLLRYIEEHEAEGRGLTGFQACVNVNVSKKCEVFCEDASEAQFAYTGYFIFIVAPTVTTQPATGIGFD